MIPNTQEVGLTFNDETYNWATCSGEHSYHPGVGYWHAYKQDPQMTGTGNHRR